MLDDFIPLSEELTGVKSLDRDLASQYLKRFVANPGVGGSLQDLITAYKNLPQGTGRNDAIAKTIMGDDNLRPVAQQLIYLWYVSAFFELDPTDPNKFRGTWKYGPPEHYEKGLVWSVINAHAPMSFGGPVDYWTTPPQPGTYPAPAVIDTSTRIVGGQADQNTTYDVVIVGSGVAGALTAFRLASAGVKVLILEAGDIVRDRKPLEQKYATSSSKSQNSPFVDYVSPQPNAIDPPQPIAISQQFGRDYYVENPAPPPELFTSYYENLVGGSTWHWQGIYFRMVPNDFLLKSQYGQGLDWPIQYKDLEPWYCEAEEEMGVAGDHRAFNGLFGAFRSKPFPMPAISPSYVDKQFMAKLKGQKFDGMPVKITTIPQAKNSRKYDGRPACDGRSSCIPLCPIKAKYEAIFHLKKAIDKGAILQERSIVTRLELDGNNKLISKVVYKRWDGTEGAVQGRIVVLAANAVEIPKLLLMSNLQVQKGVANSSDQVGRNLMDHPIKMSFALAKDPVFPFRGPPSTSSIESLRDGTFRKHRGAFRTTIRNDGWTWPTGAPRGATLDNTKNKGTVLDFVGNRRLFGDSLRNQLAELTSRQIMVNSAVEMLPSPDNRVMLSDVKDIYGITRPKIIYKIDDYTRASFLAAIRLHAQIFDAMQATEYHLQADSQQDAGSGHIMGTTIMGLDRKSSVVDGDCRSHDHPNLFILGSSVFPTSSTANPTGTIAALALRAAKTIQAELSS